MRILTRTRAAIVLAVATLLAAGLAIPAAHADGVPIVLMPLGDSITRGTGGPGTSGYRIFLQGAMKAGHTSTVEFVGSQVDGACCDKDHEGHGGWDTSEMLPYVDGWLDTYNPNFVLLHMGTNDITAQIAGQSGYSASQIADRLGQIIRKIHVHNPNAHVYVAKITGTTLSNYQTATDSYNALIPGVVSTEVATYPRTYLVDMSSIKGQDLYDARHPNELGYEKMSYKWYERIRQTIVGADNWPAITNPWSYVHYTLCFWNYTTQTRSCDPHTRDYVNGVSTWIKD